MNEIYFTKGIEKFFWDQYEPNSVDPIKGIVLAGLGSDNKWYANTARRSDYAFDITKEESFIGSEFRTLKLELNKQYKIIPYIQYKQKEVNKEIRQFLEEKIVFPFESFILVKPSREIGKRHFVTEYFPTIKRLNQGSIKVIDQINIDPLAHKQINNLMDWWNDCHKRMRQTQIESN